MRVADGTEAQDSVWSVRDHRYRDTQDSELSLTYSVILTLRIMNPLIKTLTVTLRTADAAGDVLRQLVGLQEPDREQRRRNTAEQQQQSHEDEQEDDYDENNGDDDEIMRMMGMMMIMMRIMEMMINSSGLFLPFMMLYFNDT